MLPEKMRKKSKTSTAPKSEISDYEKIREENIAEREAVLSSLKADFSKFKKDSGLAAGKKAPPKKKKRVKEDSSDDAGESQRKSARLSVTAARVITTTVNISSTLQS